MQIWKLMLVVLALTGASLTVVPGTAQAAHNGCAPHDVGDDMAYWSGTCRNFIVNSVRGQLLDRTGLFAHKTAFTSAAGRFSENFLWYSDLKPVTVTDPNTNWSSCDALPASGDSCDPSQIEANFGGIPYPPDGGSVLEDYGNPPSITFSAFEFDGMWIARTCGNWLDVPGERPKPIPFLTGIKFQDDNRNGTRQAGEMTLQGWQFRVTRIASDVGQPTGLVGTVTTNAAGRYQFDLDGHGPGTYRVEEVVQDGWKEYTTDNSHDVKVEFGGGNHQYDVEDFGNARTSADVAKTSFEVVDPPERFDVRTPTDITVLATIENLGPAHQVEVVDEVVAVLPEDCVVANPRQSVIATLVMGTPQTKPFTFSVTCERPSFHDFVFEDALTVTSADVTDPDLSNNLDTADVRIPVFATTDVSAGAGLECDDRTDVGLSATCTAEVSVTNTGYGPLDLTAVAELDVPDDCVATPGMDSVPFADVADGDTASATVAFSVVCSHRSFHEFEVSVAATADDIHVIEADESNNIAGDGPSIMEVFHDARLEALDAHLTCDEVVGDTSFTCAAAVDFVNQGPAPMVHADLTAELSRSEECSVTPGRDQATDFVLDVGVPVAHTFEWAVECPPSDVLHPFSVVTDIRPAEDEPHAVDDPGEISDEWVVPYCLPTVNPHGQREPQAPGSGQNEDGFYIFGTLAGELAERVSIRDNGSGTVFGPFPNGTRVKYVEANGAEPSISEMGGNNGNGNGAATAVGYQINGQGDAEALFVDERGVEVSAPCLVPPFPK